MRNRERYTFRPGLETVEDRCLAAAHGIAGLAAGGTLHGAAQVAATVPAVQARHAVPSITAGGKIVVFGSGQGQGGLPANYIDWGVITLWNTTSSRVTFSVSASTYQGGRYFNFTLKPGQCQSYYAAFSANQMAPAFRVSFDTIHQFNAILLSDENIVFEKRSWYPAAGTEGRPYAIANSVSGLYLTPI